MISIYEYLCIHLWKFNTARITRKDVSNIQSKVFVTLWSKSLVKLYLFESYKNMNLHKNSGSLCQICKQKYFYQTLIHNFIYILFRLKILSFLLFSFPPSITCSNCSSNLCFTNLDSWLHEASQRFLSLALIWYRLMMERQWTVTVARQTSRLFHRLSYLEQTILQTLYSFHP